MFECIEGSFADDGHIGGCIIFAQAGFIFTEGDIQCPVEGVFDAPVGADGLQNENRVRWQRGDIVSNFIN